MLRDDHVAEESLLSEAYRTEPDTDEVISEYDSAHCAHLGHAAHAVPAPVFRPCLLTGPDGQLTFPCGACLQVAMELGGPDLQVVACDPHGHCEEARVRDLATRLPYKGHK